ncbi:MAG: hypothetical protein HUJ97_01370 [Bacteroidales bacterium]|nr:hypothetical protein [Bacteroidales bacterium]
MRTKFFSFIMIVLLSSLASIAQTLPSENIFFVSDKIIYQQGDSIKVEGHLLRTDGSAERQPYSALVYLELLNEKDSIFMRQRLVTDDYGAFTSVLPPTYAEDGYYFLRAYTKMMCNFGDATIPTFPIEIRREGFFATNKVSQGINCDFFPEGGHLLAGEMQKVAIHVTDDCGVGVQTDVRLFNDKGEIIQTAKTTSSGWQILVFIPQEKTHYYININSYDKETRFILPETAKDACTLRANVSRSNLNYNIYGQQPQESRLYAYHQATGLLALPDGSRGRIDIEGLSEGIMSLVLLDKDGKTISESHCWIGERMKDVLEQPKTYIAGQLLTSVTNDSLNHQMVRFIPYEEYESSVLRNFIVNAETIIKYNGISSSEPFPMSYSFENANERYTDLNAWLCSASFNRFDIAKTLDKGFSYKYKPETYNKIQGTVYGEDKNWKLKEGSIVAFQRSNGETFSAEMNNDGTFLLPIGDYPDKEEFFITAYDEKGKTYSFIYEIADDTIPAIQNFHNIKYLDKVIEGEEAMATKSNFSFTGFNDLPEVTVKARIKHEEAMPTEVFYGHKLLTQEVLEKKNFQSFQQLVYHFSMYMVLRKVPQEEMEELPGGKLTKKMQPTVDEYMLLPASKSSVLSGKHEIPIYIDGAHISTHEAVYSLNMDDIASAQFLSPAEALGRHHGALDGVFEITTKKYRKEDIKSKGVIYQPEMGTANYSKAFVPTPISAPKNPGKYVMVTDNIKSTGEVVSNSYVVEVK